MHGKFLVLAGLFLSLTALAGPFGGNKVDDLFTVKSLDGKQATLDGKAKGLKEGDTLYFARSPYKFSVTAVSGNQVTIALPEKHDLATGATLMRNSTEQVLKAIDTESKLKKALEE